MTSARGRGRGGTGNHVPSSAPGAQPCVPPPLSAKPTGRPPAGSAAVRRLLRLFVGSRVAFSLAVLPETLSLPFFRFFRSSLPRLPAVPTSPSLRKEKPPAV